MNKFQSSLALGGVVTTVTLPPTVARWSSWQIFVKHLTQKNPEQIDCLSKTSNLRHLYIFLIFLKVFMQRNFTPTFCDLSVEVTYNGLVTSFTDVHYLASFMRNLALNNMQISYL